MKNLVILFLGFLCLLRSNVNGSCIRSPLVLVVTPFGNKEDHCTYNDLKILPGSKFTLTSPDCMQCSCSKAGLECCGYGFAAGKITPPEGCIVINDACKPVFVRKDKPTEKCTPAKSQTEKKVSAKKIG